ncbi:MAG TPA: hypothetical protein VD788_11110, partial [Candidatus Polarisedimenticolaceae bacterium]|nr:hypothetical protein [Candidatus Polarisedimenticolaceae bacterium]
MPDASGPGRRDRDKLLGLLEGGLVVVVLTAPLPFGAVTVGGRAWLEILALALLGLWCVRAVRRPTVLPPRAVTAGLLGVVGLGLCQAIPLPDVVVSVLSPQAREIHRVATPPAAIRRAEAELLPSAEVELDRAAALSVDPGLTASATRTGAALTGLLLIATTVAATRGARSIALALLGSAAFQSIYGLLVLVSGHDRIWQVPKRYFLDSATGTFVNRNHFAGLLAMSLACGLALILASVERPGGNRRPGRRW